MNNLTKDDTIVIVPADKGKCLVMLNAVDYEEKCKSQLSDRKTYKPLRYNPTSGF